MERDNRPSTEPTFRRTVSRWPLRVAMAGMLALAAAQTVHADSNRPVFNPIGEIVGGTLMIDGEVAPDGTTIEASCNDGVIAGRTVTRQTNGGNFRVVVYGDLESDPTTAGQCKPDQTISFVIGGVDQLIAQALPRAGATDRFSGTLIPGNAIIDLASASR